jgi:hypothetical protein
MLDTIRLQAAGCEGLGCPFYARLLSELGDRLGRPGTIAAFLAPYSDAPFAAAYPLRLLGGVHRLVLAGAEPAIAAHYPSVGGDGDAAGAARAIERLLGTPPPALVDAMRRPPQTNEVGRAAALASGLAVVARAYGRPIRLRELGSSGGLNLRLDSYWYEHEGAGWGTPASAVRFTGLWSGGGPPFGAGAEIVDRRGCDRDPIDVASVDGALTLLSYVWPEPSERFVRARAAMALARDTPVAVDRADIVAWLPKHVDQPRSGTALVVMHSVVWQYLDEVRGICRVWCSITSSVWGDYGWRCARRPRSADASAPGRGRVERPSHAPEALTVLSAGGVPRATPARGHADSGVLRSWLKLKVSSR